MYSLAILLLFPAFLGALSFYLVYPSRRQLANAHHWIEKAQLYYGVTLLSQIQPFSLPVLAYVIGRVFDCELGVIALAVLVALAAALHFNWRFRCTAKHTPVTRIDFLRTSIIYWTLMGTLLIMATLILVTAMPAQFDSRCAAIVVAWGVMFVSFQARPVLWILLQLGWIKQPSLRLSRIMEAASRQSGVRAHAVYEADVAVSNAVALPTVGTVIFTRAILEQLDDSELEAVAKHEICHLGMSRWQLGFRMCSMAGILLLILLQPPLIGTFGGLGSFLAICVTFFPIIFLSKRISRHEEERADRAAALNASEEGNYARALEKIYQAEMMPVDLQSSGGHPSLYDRMTAAGVQPSYARPGPPRARLARLLMFVQLILILIGIEILAGVVVLF